MYKWPLLAIFITKMRFSHDSEDPVVDFSEDRIKKLFEQFKGKRIGVVGDMMLDRYYWGTISRISPEAPVPVVEVE